MKEKKEKIPLKTQLAKSADKLLRFVSAHRATIMIVVFGLVVSFSLYRARTYSNQSRNETKYEELTAQQKVTKIDTVLIKQIKDSVDDDTSSVGENISPGRTNPFSE